MKSTSKELTYEEANGLINSVGMEFPNTEHNRNMVAKAIDDFLLTLRPPAPPQEA